MGAWPVDRDRLDKLLERAVAGDRLATGKLLSLLERPSPEAGYLLSRLMELAGRAQVIGVTGVPGAGKSTLIGRLIGALRDRGYRVAVIAVDPTSPLSRGALLGDRLRMQQYSTDPRVFIRSVATRGLKGGLALAGLAMIEAFDALGYDKIIIETVGVGQAETDIMHAAHTILVVTMPGAGDDIQALKAGVMEIGDIYVVNKSDKPEAAKTFEYVKFALETGEVGSKRAGWTPRLVKTSAVLGQGIDELVESIEEHRRFLEKTGGFAEKLRKRRGLLVKLMAERLLAEALEELELPSIKPGRSVYDQALEYAARVCRGLVGGSA